jgi:glycogen debranching enzyme
VRADALRFGREQCLDVGASLRRTWLLADGAGALAAGTALGCPASRRHGLLFAPGPEGAPHLFLARTEEWVLAGGRALPVSSACYPGALHPSGHTYLAEFDAWPWPRWLHRLGDVEVTREVRLLPRARAPGTVLLRYTVRGPRDATRRLTIRPLLACRAASALTVENAAADLRVTRVRGGIVVRPYASLAPLAITLAGAPAAFAAAPDWYRRTEYAQDLAAGLPGHEDHATPGCFTVDARGRTEVVLAATTGPAVRDARALWTRSLRPPRPPARPTFAACLARAADAHLVRTREGLAVLDRLPEGGSTALVRWEALPGLLLARGCVRAFGEALLAGADDAARGTDADPAAALAWARGAALHAAARGRSARVQRALDAATFALGDRLRGAADAAGLLAGPSEAGPHCDVLANARWFALADRLATRARGGAARDRARRDWARTRSAAGAGFLARFWLEDAGHLADGWVAGAPDTRVRAGMVGAAAEALSPLAREQRQAVVERARADLVTPRGLRTLSPRDPAYRATGAVEARGIEPYVEATLLAFGDRAAVRARLVPLVTGFAEHLREEGLGHVGATFDGDPPHGPEAGAPSDARATAALLRASALLGLATG